MAEVLQFQTLSSAVEVPFWAELERKKIDLFKLDDSARAIQGWYAAASAADQPARLCIGQDAWLEEGASPTRYISIFRMKMLLNGKRKQRFSVSLPPFQYPALGSIKNTNTLEEFKRFNWTGVLADASQQIWTDITSGAALAHPWLLTRFALTTFADLKKYKHVYFFAFPSFILPTPHSLVSSAVLSSVYDVKTVHAPFS